MTTLTNTLRIITLIFVLLPTWGYSQTEDNFSDGNFISNPTWVGDTALFIINDAQQLQLNDSDGGNAQLQLPCTFMAENIEWRLFVQFNFSPSNSNFGKIYLITPSPISNHNGNGFYLQIGESLSNDAIELFYQNGNHLESICRGIDGKIAEAFALFIKVTYYEGLWEIYTGENEEILTLEASGNKEIEEIQQGISLQLQYTSSNKNRFFFDNFYFGPPLIDTTPPTIIHTTLEDDLKTVSVQFSEPLEYQSATNRANYLANNTMHPDSITFSDEFFTKCHLHFTNNFPEREAHHLKINYLSDLDGNTITEWEGTFSHITPQRYDIIITEIMADPSPSVMLPECEYIELFNPNSELTMMLNNWKLTVGRYEKELPNFSIAPQEYAIIVAEKYLPYFRDYENVIAVSSLSISDGGQHLVLKDQDNMVVHEVNFSSSWHKEPAKKEGGWALEMGNHNYPCIGEENWHSCTALAGGTPGARNSVFSNEPKDYRLEIEKLIAVDSCTLALFFNYSISWDENISAKEIFKISQDILIDTATVADIENRILTLKTKTALEKNRTYYLSIQNSGLLNSCGAITRSTLENNSYPFGLSHYPEKLDLVINEVLPNPFQSTNARYIEIYNRSQKIINLKDVKIGVNGDNVPEKAVFISSEGYIIFPNEHVAICKDKELTIAQYPVLNDKNLLFCDSLPTFSSSEGVIFLVNRSLEVIDRLEYSEEMHYSMLQSTDGVSLERVNPESATQDAFNWKSAAESAGFGTPGAVNSQFMPKDSSSTFHIAPKVFSPNNDGYEDLTRIYCQFSEGDKRVTIQIYNLNGELVRTLVNNQPCGASASYSWDGTSNSGELVYNGIYVVHLEYWDLSGKKKGKRGVVAVHLE